MDSVDQMGLSVFVVLAVFIGFFYTKKINQLRAKQKEKQAEVLAQKEKYKNLSIEMFDEVERKELPGIVMYNLLALDEARFDGDEIDDEPLINSLTEAQKMIYTIYQVELCLSGKNASIHSFFLEDYFKIYIPYLTQAFDTMKCHEISVLLEAAGNLAHMIETDSEDDLEGDYESYNFGDFTNELLSLMKSSALIKNTAEYIYENKESFVRKED